MAGFAVTTEDETPSSRTSSWGVIGGGFGHGVPRQQRFLPAPLPGASCRSPSPASALFFLSAIRSSRPAKFPEIRTRGQHLTKFEPLRVDENLGSRFLCWLYPAAMFADLGQTRSSVKSAKTGCGPKRVCSKSVSHPDLSRPSRRPALVHGSEHLRLPHHSGMRRDRGELHVTGMSCRLAWINPSR